MTGTAGNDTLGTSATLTGTGTVGTVILTGSNSISSTGTLTTGGITVNGTGNTIGTGTVTGAITQNASSALTVTGNAGNDSLGTSATLAGMSFSNVGVAVVHALEYPLGVATHCSHGAGNGLLLPFVMRFNLPTRRREFAMIARLLGEDVAGLDEGQAAERAVTAVEKLRGDIGIPGRLRELGVRPEQLRPFAEKAFAVKRILRVNPRAVTADDLEGILRAAL